MPEKELMTQEKVLQHLPLVKKVVARIFPSIPAQLLDFEDLVGYGLIGLMEAMDSFDPAKGAKFSTYAFYRIRGAILDALREMDWMPRDMRRKIHQVEQAAVDLAAEWGREPTEAEVAEKVGMDEKEVGMLFMDAYQSEVLSFEENLHQYLAHKTDNFLNMDELEKTDVQKIMTEAIDDLPEKERLVLTLYYYEELNLKEIGKVIDLSESRVSQILKKSILVLKDRLQRVEGEL